jgi:hypothetical protein
MARARYTYKGFLLIAEGHTQCSYNGVLWVQAIGIVGIFFSSILAFISQFSFYLSAKRKYRNRSAVCIAFSM